MSSKTPLEERIAFKEKRKQDAYAAAWRYDQMYEDALHVLATEPARFYALSGHFRSAVLGYYKPMRDAAAGAGIDVTKDGAR